MLIKRQDLCPLFFCVPKYKQDLFSKCSKTSIPHCGTWWSYIIYVDAQGEFPTFVQKRSNLQSTHSILSKFDIDINQQERFPEGNLITMQSMVEFPLAVQEEMSF